MNIKDIFKKNIPILSILIIPAILALIWFREGNIMGTAESGLPFYNFSIAYNTNKDAWAYYTLGHPINIGAAAAPMYWLFSQLQNVGVPGFILQAIFFWLIFAVSGIAIYKLTRELFPESNKLHSLLAVLFYWFNPFSLVNIWNRFLNNFFVFYALLPLSVYLFIKGLKDRKYIFAILVALASAILSYALTSVAFIILLWGTLLYLGIFYFVANKDSRLFIAKFFILSFILWGLMNLWWISQVFSYLQLGSFDAVTNTSFKTDTNYQTFSQISERLGNLVNIFRLKHAGFFSNEGLEWVRLYLFPVIVFLEFLIASIFLLPLVKKKKDVSIFALGGLLLFAIFFAKGSNPPLGEIFDRAFIAFPFLQLFRNPLEKIGFILSFASSILFAVGVADLERYVGVSRKAVTRSVIFLFLIIVWGFPFWTGYVFTSNEPPADKLSVGYQVKVPSDYQDISKWLSSQGGNFRLAVLPIGGEGITYTWEKGFSGVELTNQLLPRTSISFNTNIPFYDELSNNLERIILNHEDISKIMDSLNIKYIVVRRDIDWKTRKMRDPDSISSRIEKIASSSSLQKVKESGNLAFWEYTGWSDKSVYLTNSLIKSLQSKSIENLLNVEESGASVLYAGQTLDNEKLKEKEIIYPNYKFVLGSKASETPILLREDIIFPAIKILPSSALYSLIGMKEAVELSTIDDYNFKIVRKLSLLGKRLVEAEQEVSRADFEGATKALDQYAKQIQELYSYHLVETQDKNSYFLQEDLYKLFFRHFKVIGRLLESFPKDKKERVVFLKKSVRDFVINRGIEPVFGYLEKPEYPLNERIIYQFSVEKEGSYELLFNIKNWESYFKKSFKEQMVLQLDNNLITKKGELKNNVVSFGFFDLTPGRHEIGWNAIEQINLVDVPPALSLEVEHGISEKTFPIKNFDPYSTYILNVNYFIKKGSGVLVSIEGNNDQLKKGVIQRQFRKNLGADFYDYDLRNYTAYYTATKTSDRADLIFSVFPWNNCHDIYRIRGKERCEDEGFRRPYDRTTLVSLSNISLVKVMTEQPFLRRETKEVSDSKLPQISFDKINNSEYQVNIKGAEDQYALILSELYDPAWKIITSDGSAVASNHFLANGYANGWIIDKKGDYQIRVKFTPQDLLKKGQKVSILTMIMGLGVIGYIFIIKTRK